MQPALAILALSSLLIGCSTAPLPDDVSRKSTYDIVEKIRCEAKAAVEEFGQGFHKAAIVYNFQFKITENNDANVGFSLLDTLKGPGSIKVNAGAQANLKRDGDRNVEVIDNFEDLRHLDCTRDHEANWLYPLTGEVGMYNSVATFIRLQQADDPGGTRIFAFSDTLTYTTTFTGGANATLVLAPVAVLDQFRFTAANAAATGKRMDMHKVTITMAAGDQTVVTQAGRMVTTRQAVPRISARVLGGSGRNSVDGRGNFVAGRARNGDPGSAGVGGPEGLGVAGGFNNLLSTRMLQQESSAVNRALYEQDRQRQLELQRRATDVRVLVGP